MAIRGGESREGRGLELLLEAATQAVDLDAFRREALAWLDREVGIDSAFLGRAAPRCVERPAVFNVSPRELDVFQAGLPRFLPGVDNLARDALTHGGLSHRRVEDLLGGPATAIADELLLPSGLAVVASAALVLRGRPVAFVQLGRAGARGFTVRALDLARRALPVLALGEGLHGDPDLPAVVAPPESLPRARPRSYAPLTAREREVVEYVCLGLSNREVALACGTAPRTVRNQLSAVFRKLGVGSRSELVRVALTERAALGL